MLALYTIDKTFFRLMFCYSELYPTMQGGSPTPHSQEDGASLRQPPLCRLLGHILLRWRRRVGLICLERLVRPTQITLHVRSVFPKGLDLHHSFVQWCELYAGIELGRSRRRRFGRVDLAANSRFHTSPPGLRPVLVNFDDYRGRVVLPASEKFFLPDSSVPFLHRELGKLTETCTRHCEEWVEG